MINTRKNFVSILYLFILAALLFLELLFRMSIIGLNRPEYFIRIFLFVNAYTLIILFFLRLMPKRFLRIAVLFIVFLVSFVYFAQDMYYRIFNGFFSFSITGDALAGVTFIGRFTKKIQWFHFLYFIPPLITLSLFFRYKNKDLPKRVFFFRSFWDFALSMFMAIALMGLANLTISRTTVDAVESSYNYSDYDLYRENYSPYRSIDKFGVFTYLQRDIASSVSEDSERTDMYEAINDYFTEQIDHEPNDKTDVFEDKNLIMIMAESFDTYAIDPSLTPNLYEMAQNGWSYDQFYSPLYYRNTADTEFMSQTGLYPHNHVELTMEAFRDNAFPQSLPQLFAEEGYGTYSFHNYTDYFYPRSVFHPETLGYDEYYGSERLGLLYEEDTKFGDNHQWQSDYELIDKTVDILLNKDQPYFSYILTVSGHLPYDETHPVANKHLSSIKTIFEEEDREVPDESVLYYHATQYELDLAVGHLMDRLQAAGQAEDTIIMIYGDHYAYGMEREVIAAYDESKRDNDALGIQRVPMIIYNPDLEPVTDNTLFASIDVLPTLANLFGLDLDHNQVFGQDVYGDKRNAVSFSNGSLLTDDFAYDIEQDDVFLFNDAMTRDDAMAIANEYIYRRKMNNWLLTIDYYAIPKARKDTVFFRRSRFQPL